MTIDKETIELLIETVNQKRINANKHLQVENEGAIDFWDGQISAFTEILTMLENMYNIFE